MEMTSLKNINPMLELLKQQYGANVVVQPTSKKPKASEKAHEPKAPEKANEPITDVHENISKLDELLKSMELQVSSEEKKALQDFLTSKEMVNQRFNYLDLWHSGHSYHNTGLCEQEEVINGDHGIYAIIRTKRDERACALFYPALDTRLLNKQLRPQLEISFGSLVCSLKNIQKWKNCQRDLEYLDKVVERMMNSSLGTLVLKALVDSAVDKDIRIAAILYSCNSDGKPLTIHLFTTDPIEHTKKMGSIATDNTMLDLLQGEVDIFDVSLPENDEHRWEYRIAGINPKKPSLFIYNDRGDLFMPYLYIPDGMMQEFLRE
ncbi:MAG: hypothetical protein IKK43_04125 [Clostridia bacterium]|nr:hypothetical protein [Clostridia bacterium]